MFEAKDFFPISRKIKTNPQPTFYLLRDDQTNTQLLNTIRKIAKVKVEAGSKVDYEFWDSFEWKIHKNNQFFIQTGNHSALLEIDQGKEIQVFKNRISKPITGNELKKASEFNSLRELLKIRAILPQLKIQDRIGRIDILNEDKKIIAHITLHQSRIDNCQYKIREHKIWLKCESIRGYEQPTRKLIKKIKPHLLCQIRDMKHWLELISSPAVRMAQDYSNRLRIQLNPEDKASVALISIFTECQGVIDANLPGILKDDDSEFLHDFRVAIRRIRSGLSFGKGILEESDIAKFKNDFKYLGNITNRLRDIDVYLLDQEKMESLIPQNSRKHIRPFFQDLAHKRITELSNLRAELKEDQFSQILVDWKQYLSNNRTTDNPPMYRKSAKSADILSVAKKQIQKALKILITNGSLITKDCPDAKLHALRIDCKKLRYLLEFYSSLFPPKETEIFISNLKNLQDCLGSFNDRSVQQITLTHYLESLKNPSPNSIKLATALGILIGKLHNDQENLRKSFFQYFKDFSNDKNLALAKQTFDISIKFEK
jgi:CHAD domain-containing protein